MTGAAWVTVCVALALLLALFITSRIFAAATSALKAMSTQLLDDEYENASYTCDCGCTVMYEMTGQEAAAWMLRSRECPGCDTPFRWLEDGCFSKQTAETGAVVKAFSFIPRNGEN